MHVTVLPVRVWLSIALAAMAGCDRSGLDLAPVEGVVTYNGAPVADAGVLFAPTQGPSASGITDSEGRFTLMTANQPGALVGDHRVTITKAESVVKYMPRRKFPSYDTKYHIPPKFSDPSTSGLTATVGEDDNQFDFKLTSDSLVRFRE